MICDAIDSPIKRQVKCRLQFSIEKWIIKKSISAWITHPWIQILWSTRSSITQSDSWKVSSRLWLCFRQFTSILNFSRIDLLIGSFKWIKAKPATVLLHDRFIQTFHTCLFRLIHPFTRFVPVVCLFEGALCESISWTRNDLVPFRETAWSRRKFMLASCSTFAIDSHLLVAWPGACYCRTNRQTGFWNPIAQRRSIRHASCAPKRSHKWHDQSVLSVAVTCAFLLHVLGTGEREVYNLQWDRRHNDTTCAASMVTNLSLATAIVDEQRGAAFYAWHNERRWSNVHA